MIKFIKKLITKHREDFIFIVLSIVIWRIFLLSPEYLGKLFLSPRSGYFNEIYPWANFDGLHYLSIAKDGYFQYEHAFFPLFPNLIRFFEKLLRITYLESSILIVYVFFLATILLLYKLSLLDMNRRNAKWVIVLLLSFPTSFFLTAIYSEGLFLALSIGSFYSARRGHWVLSGILGGLASATRFVGIFIFPALIIEWLYQKRLNEQLSKKIKQLFKEAWGIFLVPFGLVWYMYYLHKSVGDALAFVHSQSAFGANRSSGEIILLPQVFFRYANILTTISPSNYDFWIALFEIIVFLLVIIFLIFYMRKIRVSYLVYSMLAIVVPTLSGTLSSEPRYVLAAFPIFITASQCWSGPKKIAAAFISSIFLSFLTMFFLRGYFIS